MLRQGMTILPNGEWDDYTRIPNRILKASNLSCQAKVALALLIGTYQYAAEKGALGQDGCFFFVNDRFEDFTDVTGRQFVSTAVKELQRKGLVKSKQRGFGSDRKNYYTLDWYAIFNFDGASKNSLREIEKRYKANRANKARRQKEEEIMAKYISSYRKILETSNSLTEETFTNDIINQISREYHWKPVSIKPLLAKMKQAILSNNE